MVTEHCRSIGVFNIMLLILVELNWIKDWLEHATKSKSKSESMDSKQKGVNYIWKILIKLQLFLPSVNYNCNYLLNHDGQLLLQLDSLRSFSERRRLIPHLGGAHPGGYDSKFELGQDLCNRNLIDFFQQ